MSKVSSLHAGLRGACVSFKAGPCKSDMSPYKEVYSIILDMPSTYVLCHNKRL